MDMLMYKVLRRILIPVIDKNMYDKLKSWFECDEKCQYDQSILYVNSRDRSLTDATIKKLMFDLTDEDKESELFISLYPAENIHRNMRSYFLEIAECYYCESKPKAKLTTIIKNIPPTCIVIWRKVFTKGLILSRIYVIGDTHADYDWKKLATKSFQEQ